MIGSSVMKELILRCWRLGISLNTFDLVLFTIQEPDTSDTNATRVRHAQHKCNTSETWATSVGTSETRVLHERHECDTSEKIWFDNNTSKNIFSHPYIYYTVSERLQGEEQFHSKYYVWKCLIPCQNLFEKFTTKTELFNWKLDIDDLARSRIGTHSNAASFLIETILCESTNILFSKNYWKLGKMNAKFSKNI